MQGRAGASQLAARPCGGAGISHAGFKSTIRAFPLQLTSQQDLDIVTDGDGELKPVTGRFDMPFVDSPSGSEQ